MTTILFTISMDAKDTAGKTYNQIAEALVEALETIGITECGISVEKKEDEDAAAE